MREPRDEDMWPDPDSWYADKKERENDPPDQDPPIDDDPPEAFDEDN